MKIFRVVFLLFAMCGSATAFSWPWDTPETYEECIDKYLPSAKTNRGAGIIANTCTYQFKDRKISKGWMKYYECARDSASEMRTEGAAVIKNRICWEKFAKPEIQKAEEGRQKKKYSGSGLTLEDFEDLKEKPPKRRVTLDDLGLPQEKAED